MIIVTGWLEVDPSDRAGFVEGSAEAVRLARATPGCLDFAMSADTVQDDRVNILERWASAEALHKFRGKGPEGEQLATIRSFHVNEYEVPVARPAPRAS